MSETEVRRTVEIEAAPGVVWEFLVDPLKLRRWMGSSATLDPRPGGVLDVQVVPGARALGTYVEVDPVSRVVFTWGWEGAEPAPGTTTVTVTLEPAGTGTRLTLVHDGLDAEAASRHGIGWTNYLARLAVAATGGDPGLDAMATRTEGATV